MYCVKCKYKTETLNIVQIISTNNRHMNKGVCSICGRNKSSFVSNKVLPPVRPLVGIEPSVLC